MKNYIQQTVQTKFGSKQGLKIVHGNATYRYFFSSHIAMKIFQ